MTKENSKTHWLQNPNKNYLGHWDLPDGKDIIVTIKSAKWEEVTNPIINTSEAKRVVRFEEKGVKPWICNQTNAQSVLEATGQNFMEESIGCKITLFVGLYKKKKTSEGVDCIRVRTEAPILAKPELTPTNKNWGRAMTQVQLGEATIDSIRENWTITDEHFNMLNA